MDYREEMMDLVGGIKELKAPFPWFGGKSRVADIVWDRFGDVPNYVEPFFGSGAVLLGRPHAQGTETVNDLDCMLANFWRALRRGDTVSRLRKFFLHLRLLWAGVCPVHGKVIEMFDSGCTICKQQDINRRARGAAISYFELTGGRRG
jgi:hypothetical protein